MSYARKVDLSHAHIRDGLRKLGYQVLDIHTLPGALDLQVLSHSGLVIPLEVKTPGEKLTTAEAEYLSCWPGYVVYSLQDAVDKIREIDQWRIVK